MFIIFWKMFNSHLSSMNDASCQMACTSRIDYQSTLNRIVSSVSQLWYDMSQVFCGSFFQLSVTQTAFTYGKQHGNYHEKFQLFLHLETSDMSILKLFHLCGKIIFKIASINREVCNPLVSFTCNRNSNFVCKQFISLAFDHLLLC